MLGFRCLEVVDVGRTVRSPRPTGEVMHLTATYDLVVAAVSTAMLVLYLRSAAPAGRDVGRRA